MSAERLCKTHMINPAQPSSAPYSADYDERLVYTACHRWVRASTATADPARSTCWAVGCSDARTRQEV